MKVINLLLDEANARLDVEIHSQEALMWDLFHNEGAMEIVESIAEADFFSNELMIVTARGSKVIVLEGNRRAAALKAILNPRSVPAFRQRIDALFADKGTDHLEEILVMVAPSRDAARPQLARIHTTQPRRKWSPLRQAHFFLAQIEEGKTLEQLANEYPRVDVARFARMWQMHRVAKSLDFSDDESTAGVVNSRKFNITTLERVYDSEEFRKAFHVRFESNGMMIIASDRAEFETSFKNVVRDVANKTVTSRTINSAEDLRSNIERWGSPPASSDGTETTAQAFDPPAVPVTPKLPRSRTLPWFSTSLVLQTPGVERRLEELRKLPYATYPNTTMDSIRTILECVLKTYFNGLGTPVKPEKGELVQLPHVLAAMKKHLGTGPKNRDLRGVMSKLEWKPKGGYSVLDHLQAANHNPQITASREEVEHVWSHVFGLLHFALSSNKFDA